MSERPNQRSDTEYEHPQNFGRRLTLKELDDIRSTIAAFHFSQDSSTPLERRLLHAAEALDREVTLLLEDNPLPESDDTA